MTPRSAIGADPGSDVGINPTATGAQRSRADTLTPSKVDENTMHKNPSKGESIGKNVGTASPGANTS